MGLISIIFNLALTSQLVAPAGSNTERIADLQEAIKLYDLAFNMPYQDHFNECNSLYILAVVNKMSLAHEHFDNAKTAGKCFRLLMSTMMYKFPPKRLNHERVPSTSHIEMYININFGYNSVKKKVNNRGVAKKNTV
jgi:hypothetical protein